MNPDPTMGDGDALASPRMRSVFERMTNPQPQDMNASDRLGSLGSVEVEKMVELMITYLQHLASKREGMVVTKTRDDTGWTVRIDHG